MDQLNSYMNRLVKYPPDSIIATVERPIHPPQWPANVTQPGVKMVRKKKSISRSEHEADRMSNTSEASYEIISNISSHSPPLVTNNVQTTSTSVQTSESQMKLENTSQVVQLFDEPNCGHQQYIEDLTSQIHSLQAQLNSYYSSELRNIANNEISNQIPPSNYHDQWSTASCNHQSQLGQLTLQVTSLNDELTSQKNQNEQLLNQLQQLKQQNDEYEKKKQEEEALAVPTEEQNYKEILIEKENEISVLKNDLDMLRHHSDQLIASERHMNARHLSSIQKELRECKNQLQEMTKEASNLKSEVESLKSSLVAKESITAQLAQEKLALIAENDSIKQILSNLQNEVDILKQNNSLNQPLNQQVNEVPKASEIVSNLQIESEYQIKMSSLNKQMNGLKLENDSLKTTIDKLNNDLKSLRLKSDEEISKLTMDYSERIEQLRDENLKNVTIQADLEQSLNATRQELLQVLQKLHSITKASLLADLPTLKIQNMINTYNNTPQTSPSHELNKSNEQFNDRQQLLDQLDELKKQIESKDAAIEDLNNKLSQYAAYYEGEITRLTREIETANSKSSYMENELIRTQHRVASMHSMEQQLKEAINKVICSNSKLRNEMVSNSLAYKEDILASVQYLEEFLTRQAQEGTG